MLVAVAADYFYLALKATEDFDSFLQTVRGGMSGGAWLRPSPGHVSGWRRQWRPWHSGKPSKRGGMEYAAIAGAFPSWIVFCKRAALPSAHTRNAWWAMANIA